MARCVGRLVVAACALAGVLTSGLADSSGNQERGDAAALFRDEIVDAPVRLRMKESSLSDETRFAAAVSGLSWRPTWNDRPLIVQKAKLLSFADGPFRWSAFEEARGSRANKIAFAFALSLVLHPPHDELSGWRTAFDYLRSYGPDLDKALTGIVTAPDKLPLLYEYRHAAADVLVYRASPRLMPLFLGLAGADDRYLRSRAIVGLGVIGYRGGELRDRAIKGLLFEPRETGVSTVQAGMIDEAVRRAAEDKDYRVRAAAALALQMTGDDRDRELLPRLLKDRAYIETPASEKGSVAVTFPVRSEAARALNKWGGRANDDSGIYDARSAARVIRGAQNVSKDAREEAKKVLHSIRFSEADW